MSVKSVCQFFSIVSVIILFRLNVLRFGLSRMSASWSRSKARMAGGGWPLERRARGRAQQSVLPAIGARVAGVIVDIV